VAARKRTSDRSGSAPAPVPGAAAPTEPPVATNAIPAVDPARPFADPKAVASAIAQLSPDEAQFFIGKLEQALRRRRLQAIGYLVALALWLVGMVFALAYYGAAPEGEFVGWVFLVPFALAGVVMLVVGRWTGGDG
jgi:hypothetical protein